MRFYVSEQRKIQYINAGLYCFTFEALAQHLHTLENNNAQSEYYLTDLPPKVADVKILEIDDEEEIYNVNSREQIKSWLTLELTKILTLES